MSADPAGRAGYLDHPPRMGFFTDTSICIGCKACEVACKEWNAVPEDGLSLSGMSYDNTVGLGASTWRHVAFIEQPVSTVARRCRGRALADGQRRVQALHRVGLPGRVPDRRAVPDRVRHRGGPGRRVQRLRLLRPGLPVRGDRPARGGRAGAQVHAVLRPAGRRDGARLRQGLPDRFHPVRPAGRAARAGPAAGGGPARGRARTRRSSTWTTRTTASAAAGRSSCCWTSPRCTACRRTRWSPPATCRTCGSTSALAAAGLAATGVALGLGRRK